MTRLTSSRSFGARWEVVGLSRTSDADTFEFTMSRDFPGKHEVYAVFAHNLNSPLYVAIVPQFGSILEDKALCVKPTA